jgi:hypothetical protein
MKSFFMQTRREKAGALDGMNLFFGALLGANLGTLDGLEVLDYANIVVLLAFTVMVLRMVSTSERRGYMFSLLAAYALLLLGLVTIPTMKPDGMTIPDLHRLVATLGIWVGCLLAMEITPVMNDPKETEPVSEGQA